MNSHMKAIGCPILVLLASSGILRAQAPEITTQSPLPAAIVGRAYSQSFSAAGGTAPYRWGFVGTVPDGLGFNAATGVLSGTPDRRGTFNFTIQLADASDAATSKVFSLTVNTPPLVIPTEGPLFTGTVGLLYSQVFLASGGTPPYRWALTGGQPPAGLSFDATAGALTGTPTTTGVFTVAVRVTDSVGASAAKSFQLTVEPPRLNIIAPSTLPNAIAGTGYSQKFSATGGTPPYTWSLGGSVAGLAMDAPTGTLSGVPPAAGSFTLNVQVKDSAGVAANRAFPLVVNAVPLAITTDANLPAGAVGAPWFHTFAAGGGVPPYTWTANGLPDGLSMDSASGTISGTPLLGGSLLFTVKVTDSARATAITLFRFEIGLPPPPTLALAGPPDTANPAEQPALRVIIDTPYPVPISGRLTLTFAPEVGPGDSTIQFITGGREVDFEIPAGSTEATFPVAAMALQTGTVAGTITLAARFSAAGVDLTPDLQPTRVIRINRGAPGITAVKVTRTATELMIQVTGFSTAREITQAVYRFKPANGSTLQQSSVTVSLESLFTMWYQDTASVRYGSQFLLAQPFTIAGDPNAVICESVTLTNRLGSTTVPVN